MIGTGGYGRGQAGTIVAYGYGRSARAFVGVPACAKAAFPSYSIVATWPSALVFAVFPLYTVDGLMPKATKSASFPRYRKIETDLEC